MFFKPLGVRGASIFFWGALAAAFVAATVAVSGIGHSQSICDEGGLEAILADLHPALAEQARGKAQVIPFRCSSFQTTQWWTWGGQMWFVLFSALTVLLKKLPIYKGAVIGAGTLATAQAVVVDWNAIIAGGGVTGELYAASLRTFWGFFACIIVNPALIMALCDLDWALTQRRKQQKAQLRLRERESAAPTEASSEEDSLKRSPSEATDGASMV